MTNIAEMDLNRQCIQIVSTSTMFFNFKNQKTKIKKQKTKIKKQKTKFKYNYYKKFFINK